MTKVIAVVGMPGAGKTEASSFFVNKGLSFIRLGQLTLDEVIRKGLKPGEASERPVREEIRKKHGKAAYATLNFPKIDGMLKKSSVVADGLYSWEEYLAFKKKYGNRFFVVAVYASPKTRYKRLSGRRWQKNDKKMVMREYTEKEAQSRDYAELENLNKGGPIAMADFTMVNDGSKKDLLLQAKRISREIGL